MMDDLPKATEHVMAHKQWAAGRVTVHEFRGRYREDDFRSMTTCGLSVDNTATWLWVELRTLNPERVDLCRRCWRTPDGR